MADSPDNSPSTWSRFVSSVAQAAQATGRGVATGATAVADLGGRHGHLLVPALNGLVGDKLAAASDSLAIPMSFRKDGQDVVVEDLDLASRLQGKGRTVVVMVHGHMADEVLFQIAGPGTPGYGTLLERHLGVTVLYVRYNSGLHISDNGRSLSALLQSLVEAAGADLDRLILVGHSMGGLVVRSAGYYAAQSGAAWIAKLSTVVLLTVPQSGSYVEQLASIAAVVLKTVASPHTRIIGTVMDLRSAGIKDMLTGAMVDEDRPRLHGLLPLTLFGRRTPVAPLPGVDYHVLVATLTGDDSSLLASLFGDGLISTRSARGLRLLGADDPVVQVASVQVFPHTAHHATLFSPAIALHLFGIVSRARAGSGGIR